MRWYHVAVGATIGAACAAALIATKDGQSSSVLPPCPFWSLTGLLCPGCGTTRAIQALLRGNLFGAIAWNPLLVVLVPLMLLLSWNRLVGRKWLGWAVLTLICAFWIVRNLPWKPFSLLAPGGMLR